MDEALDEILIKDIIGKTITDIRCKFGVEDGWLDTAECFVEIDKTFFIEIPFGKTNVACLCEPHPDAKNIFTNLSDIPYYHVNIENRSTYEKQGKTLLNDWKSYFFGRKPVIKQPVIKEYTPFKVEYRENKLKYLVNRAIVDFLWDDTEKLDKAVVELDNGYVITEKYMSPSGTGQAGLHYYTSTEALQNEESYFKTVLKRNQGCRLM